MGRGPRIADKLALSHDGLLLSRLWLGRRLVLEHRTAAAKALTLWRSLNGSPRDEVPDLWTYFEVRWLTEGPIGLPAQHEVEQKWTSLNVL